MNFLNQLEQIWLGKEAISIKYHSYPKLLCYRWFRHIIATIFCMGHLGPSAFSGSFHPCIALLANLLVQFRRGKDFIKYHRFCSPGKVDQIHLVYISYTVH